MHQCFRHSLASAPISISDRSDVSAIFCAFDLLSTLSSHYLVFLLLTQYQMPFAYVVSGRVLIWYFMIGYVTPFTYGVD